MVTDVMLKNAAAEAEQAFLTAVTDLDMPAHEFSKPFERKIKSLIRKAKHPVPHQTLRYAAVIVLVLATLFATVVAVSPDVRAGVAGWFRSSFNGIYAHYDNMDVTGIPDAAAEMEYDYFLPEIPQQYTLLYETEKYLGRSYIYLHVESGNLLQFSYGYATGSGSSFIDLDGYTHESVRIGALEGDLYTTTVEGESNALIWVSKHGGVLFELIGGLDGEQLIALAESVQYQKATEENEP